jgi:hypothetical protein
VVKATYEMAYHLLNNEGLLDDTGEVRDISVGTISLSLVRSPPSVPRVVRDLVKPLLVRGGNAWWRAN